MRAISRVPMLQNVPEIHREIMGFCVHFAVVVLTHSQRITYADVFIVGDVGSALKILGACFFGKHPYTEDRTYLGDIRWQLRVRSDQDLSIYRFGNNRLFVCSV